ncbi:TetR family transcriptional regulator [Nonomuraea sp. NPDC000554]|uniref:TetR family transcriptional regulator n=1 Tax=Nonomuraea sp. NPDC000554 TaxID=3154259 RepID=UPI003328E15B
MTAAAELFVEKGYRQTSFIDIADKALATGQGATPEAFTVLLVGAVIGVHAQWRVAPEAVDLEAVHATIRGQT